MTPTVLLALIETTWLGTARAPRMLARAGFNVAVLAPVESLTARSRYIRRLGAVDARATPLEWLEAFARMVEDVSPSIVVPGDEMALRLLFKLVRDPPPAWSPARRERVASLVVASLGDPRHYLTSIDKTLLPEAAAAAGVRVPAHAVVATVDAAVAAAERLGWPVALKRRMGFGSTGVAFAESIDAVAAEAARLLRPEMLDFGEFVAPRLLVQAFLRGPHHSEALVAVGGRVLAGFAWQRHVLTKPVNGQTSVLRFVDSRETRDFSERLGAALGLTGFYNVQFIVDPDAGGACVLEINRRMITHMHLGERVGCDLGGALFAAMTGAPPAPNRARIGPDECVAVFPREWLRDPGSPWLDRYPADIPWDEPHLVREMARMWRE